MSRRFVTTKTVQVLDEKGGLVDAPILSEPTSDISIDKLLNNGLLALQKSMRFILHSIEAQGPTRETIQNLKDCMLMLHELKEKEAELLKDLSEEELKTLLEAKVNGSINSSNG
jgi:hypothetical protein